MNYRAEAITQEEIDILVRRVEFETANARDWRDNCEKADSRFREANESARSAWAWVVFMWIVVGGVLLTFLILHANQTSEYNDLNERARDEADDLVWEAVMLTRVAEKRAEDAERRELRVLRQCVRLEP